MLRLNRIDLITKRTRNEEWNPELTCFGEGNMVITTSLVSVTSKGDSFVRIPFSENIFMTLGLLVDKKGTEALHGQGKIFANKILKNKLDQRNTTN